MVRKIKLSEATANTNDLISSIKSNAESILRDIEDIKGCKFDSEAVRLLKAVKKDIIDARSGMSGVRTSCSAKYGSANESLIRESGEVDVWNTNSDARSLSNEVESAIREAVGYIDSGDAYPTWHWNLGDDDEYDYELVLGFSGGYSPNEDEFTDSNGYHLCLKWARVPKNSAMNEYDVDYEMVYDEESGDVRDTEVAVSDYNMYSDISWLLKDFGEWADAKNGQYMDESLLHTNDLSEDELEYSMEKYVGKPVEEARQFLNDLGFDMFVMAGPSKRNDTWEEYTSNSDYPGSLSVKLYFDLVPDSRDPRRKKNGKLTEFSVFRYE